MDAAAGMHRRFGARLPSQAGRSLHLYGGSQMTAQASPRQPLPLQGVRVVELTHIVAGTSAGVMLADLGADIIKIEHPDGGDTSRNKSGEGATFFTFARNKRYLALDLR